MIDFATSQTVPYGGEDPRNHKLALAFCELCGGTDDLSLVEGQFYCCFHR